MIVAGMAVIMASVIMAGVGIGGEEPRRASAQDKEEGGEVVGHGDSWDQGRERGVVADSARANTQA